MFILDSLCWICGEEYNGLAFGAGMVQQEPLIPAWEKGTYKITSVSKGHDEQFKYYTDH